MTADELMTFWSSLGADNVHADDRPYVRPDEFETNLHPVPWVGPLKTARVYLLFLNPGLSPDDVPYETNCAAFVDVLRENVRQGTQPYFYLLERFRTHPGYVWARATFGPEIGEAQTDRFCVLQLVPYHSERGAVARHVATQLASSNMVRSFVKDTLLPRSLAGDVGVVVARSAKLWQVDSSSEGKGLIVYRGGECRRALQTRGTRGGKLLREMIC